MPKPRQQLIERMRRLVRLGLVDDRPRREALPKRLKDDLRTKPCKSQT